MSVVARVARLCNLFPCFFEVITMPGVDQMKLSWIRPSKVEYPKVWHTFKARDIDSNELVEYRIQDLPQSRAEDAYEHMFNGYIQDQPISQQFRTLSTNI